VLCRRAQNSDPLADVAASPTASTRVGVVVTLSCLGLLGVIAAAMWGEPRRELVNASPVIVAAVPITSDAAAPATAHAPAVLATDADAVARREELARIAKSDIWQRPAAPQPLEVVPLPQLPGSTPDALAHDANPTLDPTLAERDAARHREIAAAIEQRAREHEQALQVAAIAGAREKIRIVVYTAAWCGNCKRAIAYLQQQHGLHYAIHDIDLEPSAREKMRKLNPEHTIPTFQIDDTLLVGFSPRTFEGALDAAARKRAGLSL
jgi:glutaredoxin